MIIHNVQQGSEAWHALRASVDGTASEAPAMMGESKYQTRDEFLKQKATGIAKEISAFTQRIFDDGHATEASIRPYVETIVGEELYPVTGTIEIEGLVLLASFDGLTMMEDQGFEHKLWNEALAARVRAGDLEPHYYWQLEQQLLISKADCIVFVVSNGTREKCVWMNYYPVPGRAERLIAGWKQFKIDRASYVLPETEAPKAVAEPVESLPAIRYDIDLTKGIAIHSNLDVFKAAAERLVEKSKEELVTDQDFANAAARVKECEKAEKNIDSLIDRVLGDLGDADKFKRDMESIKEFIRQSRLNQSKKITQRNEIRKIEIVAEGKSQLEAHIGAINAKLSPLNLPVIAADFAGAIKGKSKFDNMISAVNDKVAAAKIEADTTFLKISVNITLFNGIAGNHLHLFPDLQTICVHEREHFEAVVLARIQKYETEKKRISDENAERERIAAETQRLDDEAKANQKAPISQEFPPAVPSASAAEYDELAAINTPQFNEDFMRVFAEESAPSADIGEPTEFQRGLELAIKIYEKCQANRTDFVKTVREFIAADKAHNAKAA